MSPGIRVFGGDMTVSMHEISVGVFSRMLNQLLVQMDKAEAYASERRFDVNVLLQDRLAPDMFPFLRQVRSATDHAKGASARLSGKPTPVFEDHEASFADLRARVQKTLDFLATVNPADLVGAEDRPITLKMGQSEVIEPGLGYLLERAMPNFYFHLTTAYAILRHNGVPVGKKDYLGK